MKRSLLATILFGAAFTGLAVADDAEKALKEMEGTYSLKSLTKGGKAAPAEVIAEFKEMMIKGDKITLKLKDKDQIARLKLDPTKKPAHLDLTPTEGPEKDKTMKGIYKYEKGTLTIALARNDGDRPKDFKEESDEVGTIVFQKKSDK
jgi:uncharacterized protein (TIGR03067 family)